MSVPPNFHKASKCSKKKKKDFSKNAKKPTGRAQQNASNRPNQFQLTFTESYTTFSPSFPFSSDNYGISLFPLLPASPFYLLSLPCPTPGRTDPNIRNLLHPISNRPSFLPCIASHCTSLSPSMAGSLPAPAPAPAPVPVPASSPFYSLHSLGRTGLDTRSWTMQSRPCCPGHRGHCTCWWRSRECSRLRSRLRRRLCSCRLWRGF